MITYEQISNIEFSKSAFGGYKADDVDDFIEEVANAVKELNLQIEEQNKKIADLEKQLAEYKETESSLHTALVIAQETGNRLVKESAEKSEAVLADAENKARDILLEAKQKADTMTNQVSSESSELMKKTKERASEILREALTKASSITQKAKENCISQEKKYEELKQKVSDFRSSMLLMYRSHVELINNMKPEEDEAQQVSDDIDTPEQEGSVLDSEADESVITDNNKEATDAEESDNKSFEAKVDNAPVSDSNENIPEKDESYESDISAFKTERIMNSEDSEIAEEPVLNIDSNEIGEESVQNSFSIADDAEGDVEEIDLSKINFESFTDIDSENKTMDFGIRSNDK